MRHRHIIGLCAAVALITSLATPAAAQSIVQERALSFGRLAIPSNHSAGSITLQQNGVVVTTGPVISVVPGAPGRYRITGLLAQSLVSLSYSSTPLYPMGMAGGAVFLTLDPILAPDTAISDGSGSVSIEIGATLSTSGNGTAYNQSLYQGDILIMVTSP
jgi:hypothetical protein